MVPGALVAQTTALKDALAVFVAGPLSLTTLQTLWDAGVRRLVLRDPSRLFVPDGQLARYVRRGLRLELTNVPRLAFVSIRFFGPLGRQLAPWPMLSTLRAALPDCALLRSLAGRKRSLGGSRSYSGV